MTIAYHYCDATAFQSIIESRRLRLTNARKTNDRRELEFFKEKAFEYIAEFAEKNESLETFHTALGFHFDVLEDLSEYHICCLSKEKDSVGQWVAYADKGAGFAIGFDINALRLAVGAPILDKDFATAPLASAAGDWRFAPVIYGDDKSLRPHLDKILEFGRAQEGAEIGTTQQARDYINLMCAYFKHPAFRDEHEWRIIYDATRPVRLTKLLDKEPQPDIRWRYGKYGLTPYCETPNILNCIREVVVGPSNLDRGTDSYISKFLRSHAIDAKVVKSECPYR
ncbi:DUF2971 domain-containing protein [Burkholderia sp. FERM BP-3421]|uniref:DUF2971 domain-containing protein n=1 Tax=Burkholderia sp. FERM BP-3421 TaxID=1494466 RepID=UPI0023601843|nr:DUF2971 domain-containing protein [Burkholderia sp. FERM BP-3421]WDD94192.1 DUF2971 domain-containing protein [Burkholderia sp. FERM BP-3421]